MTDVFSLSEQINTDISPAHSICGHAPRRDMGTEFKSILVVGGEGEQCRRVTEAHGFEDVVTPGNISLKRPSDNAFQDANRREE